MGKLDGRTAVITAASSGLALASAKLFVAEGAHVFVTGRDQERLDAAVSDLGPNAVGVCGDARDLEHLDELFARVKDERGQIDVVFASAGVGGRARIGEVTEELFDSIFGLNARGTLFTVQKALPLMVDGGSVILTGSTAASHGVEELGVYAASKAVLRSYARTWANELRERGIRVNVLSPGPIATAAMARATQETQDRYVATVPMARMGTPEEIARAALFLACDATFTTGTELFVDGGTAQF